MDSDINSYGTPSYGRRLNDRQDSDWWHDGQLGGEDSRAVIVEGQDGVACE